MELKSFKEVEEQLKRMQVTAPTFDNAHGLLALGGADSNVTLTGNLPIMRESMRDLFDLRLSCSDGREVLVHNAVRTKMSFPTDKKRRSATYFPNMIVDDATAVNDDGKVRSITFALEGWDACFAYNYVEQLDVYGNPPEMLRAAMEASRYDFMLDEAFAPQQVFVINGLGTIVDFEVEGRHYSIVAGQRDCVGWSELSLESILLGTIQFPEYVDLDTATNACWDWRGYFNQMTMSELPFVGMSVASELETAAPQGSLYLPFERTVDLVGKKEPRHAFNMPLNRWIERNAASEAMRKWLGQQNDRKIFRAALDRVLSRPGHISTEDAVALCAGIDTLAALNSRESLPDGVLDAMTAAAVAAVEKMKLTINRDRVRGVLSMLQNDGLRQKLRKLVKIAVPKPDSSEVEKWIAILLRLRNFGAHGRLPASNIELLAGPAVDALAALCVCFDLKDAGVPDVNADQRRSNSRLKWEQSLFALKTLAASDI